MGGGWRWIALLSADLTTTGGRWMMVGALIIHYYIETN
ncbi:hypothetical protein EBBID32_5190 [Sphingobium indicum BiD32]|uniref:Uncharacterized protein n=1 Tax=Sphingobium indicum BiD32 TaxID=1301087 RepID=N1MKS3_9SPHN|nr:hypothetical protein EBBID32_5190 [Sphingobium indicum BiD32]